MILDVSKRYAYDSRRVVAGDVFICLPNGDPYIQDALDKGATDVIRMTRDEFANHAHQYFDFPTHAVTLIGITGTNGKTSVSYFTNQLLTALGANVLVIGTINSSLTTPESWDILSRIRQHIDNGGTHVVLEVSSHGIDQKRVLNFDFNVKCLTNITHDHLDYHGTFERYKATKYHFMNDYPGMSVMTDQLSPINSALIPQLTGRFHQQNVASALGICMALGYDQADVMAHFPILKAPKGRFQSIQLGQPFKVIVDFAHTPDAFEMVLNDVSHMVDGNAARVRVVFGCGGDRDAGKRSEMGRIAANYSQAIYLTADNSRSEPTLAIIDDIRSGISDHSSIRCVDLDRQSAISMAIQDAHDDDVVLILGKGHETSQIMAQYQYYFNDADVASFELVRINAGQVTPTWVMNQPDTHADVLFISKKLLPHLKISYSQFRRAIPTPSHAKVADYLAKINGQKIILLESNHRFSISKFLQYMFMHAGGVTAVTCHGQDAIDSDLAGLTLINQTNQPLLITINPEHYVRLNPLVDAISPDHVIVADVFHPNQYISPVIQRNIGHLFKENKPKFSLWVHHSMTDILDAIPEGAHPFVKTINAPIWMDYGPSLAKDLLVALDMYHESLTEGFYRYLMACQWCHKITGVSNHKGHVYMVPYPSDSLGAIQTIEYFRQWANNMSHWVLVDDDDDGIEVVEPLAKRRAYGDWQYLKKGDSAIHKLSSATDDSIVLVWAKNMGAIGELSAWVS